VANDNNFEEQNEVKKEKGEQYTPSQMGHMEPKKGNSVETNQDTRSTGKMSQDLEAGQRRY
jgi:hypothetical protein